MASRLDLLIDYLSYESAIQSNDPADAEKAKVLIAEAAVNEVCRQKKQFPDNTVDLSIALPDPSTEYLLIFTDQTVSIKLNGSADAIIITPQLAGKKTGFFGLRGVITGLTLSNSSGEIANVDIITVNV